MPDPGDVRADPRPALLHRTGDRCRVAAIRPSRPHPEKEHTMIRPAAPTRDTVRQSIADQLLEALDQHVTRHRALALHDEHIELHAELIAAEVAHQLAMTRNALRRHPAVRRAG